MTNKMTNKLAALAFMMLATVSCSKGGDDSKSTSDADPTTPVSFTGSYALITRTTNADGATFAGYMQKIASPDFKGTIDNSKATELDNPYKGAIVQFNKAIYLNNYGLHKFTRYTLPADGSKGASTGTIDVKELGFQGNLTFKDENVGYVGGISNKIIIFNPTTMKKTGDIDWSSQSKMGQRTGFPKPESTVNTEIITEIIINGDYMYAAICYMNDINTYTPATTSCSILVIDLKKVDNSVTGNKDAVVKVITNDKGSYTGAWNSSGGVTFMNKTENGDIYMLCHNSFGGARKVMNKPACLLRIKNGATDFDQDYYFDLEKASGGNGNPVMNFEYYGNGKFLASVMDPTKLDPKNDYSFNTDAIFRWWSFDLNAKTAKKVDDEYTIAGKVAKCFFASDYAYIPFTSKTSNYIKKISLTDFSKKTKTITTTGGPTIVELK